MKILILGVDGLLGQHMYTLCQKNNIEVLGTTRKNKIIVQNNRRDSFTDNILYSMDLTKKSTLLTLKEIISQKGITTIVNATKYTKGKDSELNQMNVELPLFLDSLNVRVVCISSDIVIDETKSQNDPYTSSKIKLESLNLDNTILIRTSFWGYDLVNGRGFINSLVDLNKDEMDGYANYTFSGLYVGLLCESIMGLIQEEQSGLYRIFSNTKITKFELLALVNNRFNLVKKINKILLEESIDYSSISDVSISATYREQVEIFYDDYRSNTFNTIQNCRHCNSTSLEEVMDFGLVPLAGGFLKKKDLASDQRYPMSLSSCNNCKVLQISQIIDPEHLFKDYRYLSSTIHTLVTHFQSYAKHLKKTFPNSKNVLEIGCNDGVFLRPLKSQGFDVLGIEPAKNIIQYSKEENLPVVNDFFNIKTASKIKDEYGSFDIITGNNVLAHIESIKDVFDGIKLLLSVDGFLVFEVQYLKSLFEKFQYDFIYHEHIFYYSVTSINNFLSSRSMKITHVLENEIHGGTVRIYATHNSNDNIPKSQQLNLNSYLKEENKLGLNSISGIDHFYNKVLQHRKNIRLLFDKIYAEDSDIKVAAYGASGRSVTFVNFCGLNNQHIDFFIDDSPERQGRYIPGVHIPIFSYEEFTQFNSSPDYIMITAWTFKDEIMKKLKCYIEAGGKIIIPFPIAEIL